MNNGGDKDPDVGVDDVNMWVDQRKPKEAEGCVLLADDIRSYVESGVLIDIESFKEDKLKGASYSLTPDPEGGWCIGPDNQCQDLRVNKSGGKSSFIVPQNSLAYIRLEEILKIPYYIIARHNLKIDYVYQGLLLGTGPQVDPGYRGKLIIPLHNLTNSDVEIYHDDSFVSIDFVRTTHLDLDAGTPDSEADFRKRYPRKRQIDIDKIEKRTTLKSYLNGNRPRSSLGNLVSKTEAVLKSNMLKDVGIPFALVLLFFGALVTFFCLLDSKITLFPELSEDVEMLKNRTVDSQIEQTLEILTKQLEVNDRRLIYLEGSRGSSGVKDSIGPRGSAHGPRLDGGTL